MKNNSGKYKLYFIFIILVTITMFICIQSFNSGINIGSNNKPQGEAEYKSLDELYKHTSLNLEIPEFVSSHKDLKIKCIMSQFVEIYCDTFALKAATFVNNNADPLGLYNESSIDNMYKIQDNKEKIKFFRFRSGYVDYPHCVLINWCTDTVAYGLMIEDSITEDDALDILNIDKNILIPTNYEENNGVFDNTEIVESTEINSNTMEDYIVNDKLSLKVPKFKANFEHIVNDGITTFYIDKKIIFAIIYNEYDINNNTLPVLKSIIIDDNIVFKYVDINVFEKGTDAYDDYESFISTIDIITDSINCQY